MARTRQASLAGLRSQCSWAAMSSAVSCCPCCASSTLGRQLLRARQRGPRLCSAWQVQMYDLLPNVHQSASHQTKAPCTIACNTGPPSSVVLPAQTVSIRAKGTAPSPTARLRCGTAQGSLACIVHQQLDCPCCCESSLSQPVSPCRQAGAQGGDSCAERAGAPDPRGHAAPAEL